MLLVITATFGWLEPQHFLIGAPADSLGCGVGWYKPKGKVL